MPTFEGTDRDWRPAGVDIRPARKPPVSKPTVPLPRAQNIQTIAPPVIGVPNPFGVGASAFEPATEVYEPKFDPGSDDPLLAGYDDAYNAVQKSRAKESQESATKTGAFMGGSGPLIKADGQVKSIIGAAKTLLGRPYIWGGTTARGVDCSGLLYYAFNAAGIKMPRYRAVDYGRMGQGVAMAEARAGDIVYWDNPGSTDHVGIYLGDGMVIQAPQSGDVVKVSKVWGKPQFRRILDDAAFGQMATATGAPVTSYQGAPANPDRWLGVRSTVKFHDGRTE